MGIKTLKNRWFPIAISLAIVFLVSLASCTKNSAQQTSPNTTSTSTLGQIAASSKIKVAYLVFPPTITKNQTTGELGGHLVDTIKEIARLNNWTPEFIETDWSGFATGLDSRRFDVSIVPTFVTVPRALSVYFTNPLFYAGNSAITKADETRFTTLESIDQPGVTVAVTQGEAGDEYAKANFKKAKITRFSGGDQSLAFQAVVAGRANIALGDAYVTSQFAKANPQVKDLFAKAPYNLTPVSWAVRKGDTEMLNFLNSSLESLDYQGRLREWEQKAGANWLHIKKVWEFTKS
ncbi:MAG: amino acid ABC transporter substrate-binding protein [Microcoleus sp. PH2017_01_SCD_O_A]|uniref:substrate-binding periplasmic protein n=1 Tax=unclassified Microcoleus TaxID=2642155 RepID=UPI001D295437|nr:MULTISPECIES: transporter substrate-binding domain-containing protein [unclassified Microcoleus]MCC3422943.1 amino acid ABC transporter substrate-binding protein [Microcoleus sp. PH2017_01_SCD_O_A]MCC3452715.1 amino acid ABC transporter substrate-binding protein [Microcoleus sp. PH2017_08_TRC_O_A]MCC3582590.1 amino acid ABC transporter substrate-binding protein [Microcoleus sp. PH2017_30_WIL_O_A]TAE70575.1 MAG: amino acid ABC transporter substrate-binding protein [Oscillatoriales cyanobacter